MKRLLVFIVGFAAGILATILFLYLIAVADKPNDGLIGPTKIPEKGECV